MAGRDRTTRNSYLIAVVIGLAAMVAVGPIPLVTVGPLLMALIVSMSRPVGSHQVDGFIQRAGLAGSPSSPVSRRFIARYLTTGRRLRLVLVTGALIVPNLVAIAIGGGDGVSLHWTWIIWACMAGTLWTELALTRPNRGGTAMASLFRREPATYLTRPLRWGPAVLAVIATCVWAGVGFLPPRTDIAQPEVAGTLDIIVAIAFVLSVPLAVTGAQRWILRRPQPLVTPDMLAVDNAIRTASIRNLAAVGIALVLLYLSGGLLQYVWALHVTAVDWLFGLATVASLVLAMVAWSLRLRPQPAPVRAVAGASA
jgi:uncharacterized membrane protein